MSFIEELKTMSIEQLNEEGAKHSERFDMAVSQLKQLDRSIDLNVHQKMIETIRLNAAVEQITRNIGHIYLELSDRTRALNAVAIKAMMFSSIL